jgi:hypothetical protein
MPLCVYQFLLPSLLFLLTPPLRAQGHAADTTAARSLILRYGGGRKVVLPDATPRSGADSRLFLQFARMARSSIACPMPVWGPVVGASVRMPVAKPDTLATVPMPTQRSECFNPLYRPS